MLHFVQFFDGHRGAGRVRSGATCVGKTARRPTLSMIACAVGGHLQQHHHTYIAYHYNNCATFATCCLPRNGVNGWKLVQRYLAEAIAWDQEELSSPNHRKTIEFFWSKFRHNFKQHIASKQSGMKLPLRATMLEAFYLDIDFDSWIDVQDIAAYAFLFFVGVRLDHVAVDAQQSHALRFEDFAF